jgi:hypothetical protein
MKVFKSILEIGLTVAIASAIFFGFMLLMFFGIGLFYGANRMNDVQFLIAIINIGIISFVLSWWLDGKLKIYKLSCRLVGRLLKK